MPVAVRALPADGKPGAPVRHLVLDADPQPLAEAARGLAVVNAGGWGMFRVGYETAHRLALAEHLARADPAGALQPAGRHLGHHPGGSFATARNSWSWPPGSASNPTLPLVPRRRRRSSS